jgi:hypothetical protein
MASIQIPNLPAVIGLSGAELFEGVQAGTSVKVTLNQIIAATHGGTPATLPIPVSLGGTGLDTFAVGDIMYASATQTFSKLADVATGNAIISGGVGAAPSYGKIGLTTHVDGVLPLVNGGTGQSSVLTQYGMIYANTTTSMASTAAGTATQVLHGGTTPSFSAVSLTADVSGTLPVANGGTNITSYAIGDILYASTSGVLSSLADVATGNALISGGVGAAPSYGKVGLTTHVSGILPLVNGGTGASDAPTARTNLGAEATITGAATTITTSDLTASRAVISNASGKVAVSATTDTELGYVSGVTSAIQTQIDNRVVRTSSIGSAVIPASIQADRDLSPSAGYFRFNTTSVKFEGYNGTAWGSVGGGATGGGNDAIFFENGQTVTANYTITAGNNAMTAGPVSINGGVVVTIPSGSVWTVL